MKLFTFFAWVSLLVSTSLFAAEHVPVGPLLEEDVAELEEEEGTEQTVGFVFDQYPPVYFSNAHHWLDTITVLDKDHYILHLEDGSGWKVHDYDGMKTLSWRANDPLTITQNTRWFGKDKHPYRLVNKSNHAILEAALIQGPIEGGIYSHFIIAIDPYQREILLNDNTRWELSYLDEPLFKNWKLNDYIIIGTNSETSFWDSEKDALLINVDLNHGVRSTQF